MDYKWISVTNIVGINIWIYITSCITGVMSQTRPIHNIYSSGCSSERIRLECPPNHKIAVKRLFYGTKNDSRCSGRGRTFSVDCCQPRHDDCPVVDDTKYPFLNMMCSGLRSCDIEAKEIQSGLNCRAKGYGETTDYMSVIHDCIPDEDTSFLCSDSHKRGKLLYISNENYPRPIRAGTQQCQCLIKTGNHVGIEIHALDIIITRSDEGNQCYQDIEIRDDDMHRKEFTCGHPGLYAFRSIYRSDVRSVTMTLNSNAPKSKGYVWIQAKAKEDSDFVEVYCGNEMKRYLGYPIEGGDRVTDSKPTTDVVMTTSNTTGSGTPKVMSDMVALIVGVSVAVAVIIIIGMIGIIILCVRRYRQRKRPVRHQPPPFPSPMMKSKENNHLSNTYCRYDYDEDKYCSIKRSPMRMTNYSNMDKNSADKKLKEAFLDGVAPSDMSNQNGYMNYSEQLLNNQNDPLLETKDETDCDSETEVIMPKSEFIAIGRAIQPRSINVREINEMTLPEKKKSKNKTVTFSPVAMVTPLPSGSEESVPDDTFPEDMKGNLLDMYSKSLPNRSSSSRYSPEKAKKLLIVGNGTQDDMLFTPYGMSSCENVTEEDLWKDFHIKLSDNVPEPEPSPVAMVPQTNGALEDPDYDENPYDNLPYLNIGSLRRKNAPDNQNPYQDLYKEAVKRNNNSSHKPPVSQKPVNHKPIISKKPTISQIPTIDMIPEGF